MTARARAAPPDGARPGAARAGRGDHPRGRRRHRLTDWLDANGYAIRDEIAARLQEYVEKGWYFVALKLTSDAPLDGMLDPVRFTFDSDELVYPMALSKRADDAAAGAAVRLPGPPGAHRRARRSDARRSAQASTVWAGPAPDVVAGLGGVPHRGRPVLLVPASQIPGDLVVVQAGDDEPLQPAYTVTRPLTVFGIPFGVVVILGAVAGIVVLRRARRPSSRGSFALGRS